MAGSGTVQTPLPLVKVYGPNQLHGSSYDTITVLYTEIEINMMSMVMTPDCFVCYSQLTNTVPLYRITLNTSVAIRNGPILYTRKRKY